MTQPSSLLYKLKYILSVNVYELNDESVQIQELAVGIIDTNQIVTTYFKINSSDSNKVKNKPILKTSIDYKCWPHDRNQEDFFNYLRSLCRDTQEYDKFIGYHDTDDSILLDIFTSLGMNSLMINIETFGCPKLEKLCERNTYPYMIFECNRHNRCKNVNSRKCPRLKIRYYMDFLRKLIYS